MLTDANVWIADMVTTVHMTPHITVGNGANKPANKIASIKGMMCDKHGNKLFSTKLTKVTH
jgi:hypothetical protein